MELFSQLDWRAFLIAMLLIEMTPGPNMGWLAALSAQHGSRVGVMAVAGVTLGLAAQIVLAATGAAALLSELPVVYHALRWAGVLFMLWLAWQAYSEVGSTVPVAGLSEKGFRRGFFANLLNPKALVFYVIIIGQFTRPELGALWWQIIILGAVHLGISIAIHLLIVFLGANLGRRLEKWRTSLSARLFFSISLVGIAVWIAVSTG